MSVLFASVLAAASARGQNIIVVDALISAGAPASPRPGGLYLAVPGTTEWPFTVNPPGLVVYDGTGWIFDNSPPEQPSLSPGMLLYVRSTDIFLRYDGPGVFVLQQFAATPASVLAGLPNPIPAANIGTDVYTHVGMAQTAQLNLTSLPADGDSLEFGGDEYEFDAASPPVGGIPTARAWITIQGSPALTLAKLADAINGVVDAANIAYPNAAVDPANANQSSATRLTPFRTTAPGGFSVANINTALNLAFNFAGPPPGDGWASATTRGGTDTTKSKIAVVKLVVTVQDIANGSIDMRFAFSGPTGGFLTIGDGTAGNRFRPWTGADRIEFVGGVTCSLVLGGGVLPDIQAGETVRLFLTAAG